MNYQGFVTNKKKFKASESAFGCGQWRSVRVFKVFSEYPIIIRKKLKTALLMVIEKQM